MTQLVALTEKADVIEDMRKDVQANKGMFQDSESKRGELQMVMEEQTEAWKEFNIKEYEIQRQLGEENETIRGELEASRQQLASKEMEHLNRLENVFQAHKLRTDAQNQ